MTLMSSQLICLNDGNKKREKIHPTVKIMVTHTWWKSGQIAFRPMPWSGCIWRLSGCHMQAVNTCYQFSSRVMASFLSCFMRLTFSSILNVQIILNFFSQWIFSPPPQKRRERTAARQSLGQFHRCRAIHHILSVWISNISLQQSRWCNRYGLWAHMKYAPWGYSIWLPREIWSGY